MREIKIRLVKHHGQDRFQVIIPPELTGTGRRKVRFFKDESEARKTVERINVDRGSIAEVFYQLPRNDQVALAICLHRVENQVSVISSALDAWLAKKEVESTLTLGKLRDECLKAKAHANVRQSYLGQFSRSVNSFVAPRAGMLVSAITPAIIREWLNGSGWRAATRQGLLKDVRTLFSFAIKEGYRKDNPALLVDRPEDDEYLEVGILTVPQVRTLMGRAAASDTPFARWLAVQLFGGLRKSEARRLNENQIREREIEVSAKTKTRSRRFVPINDTLRAWLSLPGELPIKNLFRRLRRVRGELRKVQSKRGVRMKHIIDVPYPRNCLRHSFCSYALPIMGEEKEAAAAGHSPEVAISKYRELVTEEQARKFWEILPVRENPSHVSATGK